MPKFEFDVMNLENGNFLVLVYKDNKLVIKRAHQNIKDVISLLLTTFEPK